MGQSSLSTWLPHHHFSSEGVTTSLCRIFTSTEGLLFGNRAKENARDRSSREGLSGCVPRHWRNLPGREETSIPDQSGASLYQRIRNRLRNSAKRPHCRKGPCAVGPMRWNSVVAQPTHRTPMSQLPPCSTARSLPPDVAETCRVHPERHMPPPFLR